MNATWYRMDIERPPPREGSDDYFGLSIEVLAWKPGMEHPCILCYCYDQGVWIDGLAPLPSHCRYTHWTYLPEIPKL